ncbi:LamG-like jellyroll fold domain-containing protein [Planctomycetota bacterium]
MRHSGWLSAALVLSILAAGGPAHAVPVADILALHLDETGGVVAYDATPSQQIGLLGHDAAWTTDAKFGGALSFDGQGDHVMVPDSPALDSLSRAISIEGWAKVTSNPNVNASNNYRMVLDKGVWHLILEQSRTTAWSVVINPDNPADPVSQRYWAPHPAWPMNDWVHFAYTYDGNTGQMVAYTNGTPYSTMKDPGSLQTNDSPLYLSSTNNAPPATVGGSGAFPGILDEIAVYGQVLTPAEVAARFADGPPQPPLSNAAAMPTADTLVLHFDETGGTTAYDATLPANDGTLIDGVGRGAGKFGGAVHFDGIDDHVRIPLSAAQSPTTGLTVEGWFLVDQEPNVDGANNWRWMFNKGGWATPFDCILEQNRSLMFSLKVNGQHKRWNSGHVLPMDEWAHAAWTYDAETGLMKVYLNGVERSHFIGITGPLDTNGSDLFLSWPSGTATPNGNGAFPGWMDEFAIYSHALSSQEILLRYVDGPPIFPEPVTLSLLAMGVAGLALRRRRPRG